MYVTDEKTQLTGLEDYKTTPNPYYTPSSGETMRLPLQLALGSDACEKVMIHKNWKYYTVHLNNSHEMYILHKNDMCTNKKEQYNV